MPKVSVILSAYNAEKYLAFAVESILNQTFGDFEMFLINDASTDGTGRIIGSFSDPRIININNRTNLGVAVSANRCMDMANGEYIARMDADDISMPRRFEYQVKFMDENPDVGVCGSWIDTIGPYKNYTNKYPADHAEIKYRMLYENPFCQPVIMLRKKLFDKFNLRYEPSFFPSEDYDLWEKSLECFEGANIQKILLSYRIHPKNASHTMSEKQIKETDIIRIRQIRRLAGDISGPEGDLFLNLVKKTGENGREFIQASSEFLRKMYVSNIKKRIYLPEYFDPFLAECWSYACKTDFFYGMKVYAKGLENIGMKAGIKDSAVQFVRSVKFLLKNRNA